MKLSSLIIGIAAALCLYAIISGLGVADRLQQIADTLAGVENTAPEYVGTQCDGTDDRSLYGENFGDVLQFCKDVRHI